MWLIIGNSIRYLVVKQCSYNQLTIFGVVLSVLIISTLFCVQAKNIEVQTRDSSLKYSPQQTIYLEAQAAIAKGQQQAYWTHRKQLLDYPLLPYLERSYYTQFMRSLPSSVVEAFLLRYSGDDFVKGLQFRYIAYLSTRDRDRFQHWYRLTPTSWLNAPLHCRYLTDELATATLTPELDLAINRLWQHPRSQDAACDDVFNWWQKQGGMTAQRILARIKLVATKGEPRLIVYLTRQLPQTLQPLGQIWGQVANSAGYISRIERWQDIATPDIAPVVMLGLTRLIWSDVQQAIATYQALPDTLSLTQAQHFELVKTIAIRLSLYDESDTQRWLDRAASLGMSNDLRDWQLSHYIRHQRWAAIDQFISQLQAPYQQGGRLLYWQARANRELGLSQLAQQQFTQLAQERHYYGFKASDALSTPISLNEMSVVVDPQTRALIMANPHLKMAQELFAIGHFRSARYQWRRLLNTLNDEQGKQAGVIAYEMQWYDRGIYAMAEFGMSHDVQRRFPMPFKAEFNAVSKQYQHATSWLYAIARRESAFAIDARSVANARGLMQLLPNTAQYLRKRAVSNTQLTDPANNIALGGEYLAYLSSKVSDNIVLRTAAYNAGWRNVQQWLPDKAMPMDHWIELIPFKETREYVKAVIAYERIYAEQLQRQPATFPKHASQFVSSAILTAHLETGTLSAR